MRRRPEPAIEIKTAGQLAAMWEAGQAVARALAAAAAAAVPGALTADLDAAAQAEIRTAGASPSFLGYHGFPATICASVNEQVVHAIPSRDRVLREGDVVSIDCGAIVAGWHADAALTVGVGELPGEVAALLGTCERALWAGIDSACPGRRLTDISHAVERCVRAAGQYGIVEDYGGHGIGSAMHMDPPVPSLGKRGRGPLLAEGMTLAIEPLLVMGSPETRLLDDGWTVVSEDGGWSAHFEHTVAITRDGPWVLTAPAAAEPRPGAAEPAPAAAEPRPAAGQGEPGLTMGSAER